MQKIEKSQLKQNGFYLCMKYIIYRLTSCKSTVVDPESLMFSQGY